MNLRNLDITSSTRRLLLNAIAFMVLVALLTACSGLPKQPWVKAYERSLLEDELMKPSRHESISQFRQLTNRKTNAAMSARVQIRGDDGGGRY